MYCPRCSQQQISDGVRFCSGCGLQLSLVMELLSNNGALAAGAAEARKKPSRLRRKGVRLGAKLVFLSAVVLPIAITFSVIFDSPEPLMVPSLIFLLGVAQVLYTLLFGEHQESEMPVPHHGGLSAIKHPFNLPAARGTTIPINDPKRTNTAEMVRPPSVTEHTTRLLDDDAE